MSGIVVPLNVPVNGPNWVLPLKGALRDALTFKLNGSVLDVIPRSLLGVPSGHQLIMGAVRPTGVTVKQTVVDANALVGNCWLSAVNAWRYSCASKVMVTGVVLPKVKRNVLLRPFLDCALPTFALASDTYVPASTVAPVERTPPVPFGTLVIGAPCSS